MPGRKPVANGSWQAFLPSGSEQFRLGPAHLSAERQTERPDSSFERESSMLTPKLDILPRAQRRLWEELRGTPRSFVLYGGTALALRLGHRHSEDFEFFSNGTFQPSTLLDTTIYLKNAEISQLERNTLTVIVDRGGPVKVSFFGGLNLYRVEDPDIIEDNGIQVASMLDVVATNLNTVQQRAQARDYIDIVAALNAGLDLVEALVAADSIYGKGFNGALSLKALTFFEDGDLSSLGPEARNKLREVATSVDLRRLPHVIAKVGITKEEGRPCAIRRNSEESPSVSFGSNRRTRHLLNRSCSSLI